MDKMLDEISEYFGKYSEEVINACKKIQSMTPPDYARYGSITLQHDDGFDETLPLFLHWGNGEGGYGTEDNDPIQDIQTNPWVFYDSENWPDEYLKDTGDAEDEMRLTICHWFRECWIKSGGRGNGMRFYIQDHATNKDYCLERDRFVSEDEHEHDIGI